MPFRVHDPCAPTFRVPRGRRPACGTACARWRPKGGARRGRARGTTHGVVLTHPLSCRGDVRTGGHAEGTRTVRLPSPCKGSAMGEEGCPHAPPLHFAQAGTGGTVLPPAHVPRPRAPSPHPCACRGCRSPRVQPRAPVRSDEPPPLSQWGVRRRGGATPGRVGGAAREPGGGG